MHPDDIKKIIVGHFPEAIVEVTGDGAHFEAVVVSSLFEGVSLIARQRLVYSALGDRLLTGEIHALSIKAKTPTEWEQLEKK